MHRHLVPVKVGIKGGTDQGVELNRLAFYKNRFKGLHSKTMQRWSPVQHYWILLYYLVKGIPNLRGLPLDKFLGTLDCGHQALFLKPIKHKGFEEFQGHFLGQTTLVKTQVRPYDDDRATRIVNPFAQQVLTETSLLTS